MKCPLCESDEQELLGYMSITDCLARLELQQQPAELIEEWHGDRSDLLRCGECGLDHFSPSSIASADFYQALNAQQSYYQSGRWDHREALGALTRHQRVVDLGCGDGAFVRQVTDLGGHAIGVDFAASAGPGLRPEQFVQARADLGGESLATILERCGTADVVTAFQLLEHLARPVEFMERAAELLAPGGRLIISVPNRERFEIDPLQLLDCPPHHQTRWSAAQLRTLGPKAGLEVVSVRAERVLNPAVLALRLARRARTHVGHGWNLPAAASPWPVARIINGMSLLAVYRSGS